MSAERCAKCGEELKPGALTCWACGTLTPAGRRAKGLPEDEEELWRRSVEAAKTRHTQKPTIDPEAALLKVLAETGTEEQLQRVTRRGLGHDDQRTDYAAFRSSASTLFLLGSLLAVLFLLVGMLVVAAAVMTQAGGVAILASVAAIILFGTTGLTIYFAFRYLAEMMRTVADAADNARRAVLLVREQLTAQTSTEEQTP